MKNIYHDDSFNKESKDVFSKTSYDLIKEFNQSAPEKPQAAPDVDFSENQPAAAPEKAEQTRQNPPPIKKTAPVVPPAQPQTPPAAFYAPTGAFVQQPYYPQPVVYPGGTNQAYPVFIAPNQAYPVYPQPYPGQPVAYPPVQGAPGAYPPAPVYGQPPVMQVPSVPYAAPEQNPYQQPAPVQTDPISQEAGTRVLFQSPDFDKKDDSTEGYETLPHDYSASSAKLDISEVELPSRKRAGASVGEAPASSFKIDEMEIGTYELNAMSINRSAKVSGVDTPAISKAEAVPLQHTIAESPEEVYDTYETLDESPAEIPSEGQGGIFPEGFIAQEEAEEKGKKLPAKEIIRRAVLAISLIAIVVSCGMLYNEYRLHKENENMMSNISDLIITEPPTETTTETTTAAPGESTTKQVTTTTRPTTTRYLTPSEQFELLKKENPDIVFPDNIQLKYAKLYAENQDFVGYLSASGSDIDFPVVQGVDDDEYLEMNFFGEYTKYGCPFMTFRNDPKNLDRNTVIYGHNMKDGSLFATLEQYLTLEGYKQAPVISFNTLYQDFNFKIISTMITNIKPEDDNGYVFPYYWTNLNSTLNYTAYLNQISQRSLYDTGVNVLPTDRLLTLSTCYDEFEDARLVVIARLVRPGESAEVNTSRAVENESPRFPQAYYDEHGMTNPYANAYKWEIA